MKAILGGRLIVPDTDGNFCEISGHALLYEKKIARIVPEAELSVDERADFEALIDAGGDYVAPGFVNVHIHGAMGYDAMDDDGDAVPAMARHQASTGVTSFLPTTMTCPMQKIYRALSRIRDAMGADTGGAARRQAVQHAVGEPRVRLDVGSLLVQQLTQLLVNGVDII